MNAKMNAKANMKGKGFGKSSKFFVVFRPDTEEFLVKHQETVFGFTTAWGKHPSHALQFSSFDSARKMAIVLCTSKSVLLEVCSVVDLGTRYAVETESTFFPGL